MSVRPVVTADISVSLDGFAAGPHQSVQEPLGVGFEIIHRWMFDAAHENAAELSAITGHGAFIMGRNMFGPVRGPWPDEPWRGWWGEDPPYHAPVFVLTHHARNPLVMDGGTTFHFVTDGPDAALARAVEAAGDRSIAIAGGTHTLNDYLRRGIVDELRLHVAPVLIGSGERLFDGVGELGLVPACSRSTSLVTHTIYRRPENQKA